MNSNWFIERLQYTTDNHKFIQYATPGARGFFSRIPIAELDNFRNWLGKGNRGLVKIRYRGPRSNVPSARYRTKITRQSTCLKEDATHFSVYTL
jgi:hypothetical protein